MTKRSTIRHLQQRGFTLAELMIAIGILGIGMTMAATLFPTAIKLNEASTRDTIGTIIAENGLAVAKSLLSAGDVVDPNLVLLAAAGDPNDPSLIPADRQRYPDGSASTKMGFVVLGRWLADDPAGVVHQLVIVSYDKKTTAGVVTASKVTVNNKSVSGGVTTVVLSSDGDRVGSPVIVAKNARFAAIIDVNYGSGGNYESSVLDHDIYADAGDEVFVIVESGAADSPALAVLVANTALEP